MKGTIRLSGVLLLPLNRSTWRTFVLFQHGWYVSLIEGLANIKNKVLFCFQCDEMFGKITSLYAHVVKRSIFYTSQITLQISSNSKFQTCLCIVKCSSPTYITISGPRESHLSPSWSHENRSPTECPCLHPSAARFRKNLRNSFTICGAKKQAFLLNGIRQPWKIPQKKKRNPCIPLPWTV